MCDLLVSDKLKSCLSAGTLNYVLSLEGNGFLSRTKLPSSLTRILTATWDQRMGPLDPREQRSEVGSVLQSGVGINTNLRDHFVELKEGSPILLPLIRVGHSARVMLLDVAGGVSQRITSLRTALRVGRLGRLPVTATERR